MGQTELQPSILPQVLAPSSMLEVIEARAEFLNLAELSCAYCRQHGIDLRQVEAATGGVYLVPIRPVAPRSFEFHRGGRLAAMCEVLDEDGLTVIDLAAWSTSDPTRFGTLLGRAPALGMAVAANPATYFADQPLRLFRTPLAWLRAGCHGSVLLDPARGAWWLLHLPTSKFGAEDGAHAAELEEARAELFEQQRFLVPAPAAIGHRQTA